jgi:hypothetical protein
MSSQTIKFYSLVRSLLAIVAVLVLTSCAHAISIDPGPSQTSYQNKLSPKKVGYVISVADKNKQVITAGGGGDKVSYYPYRDIEQPIREALRSIYTDVYAIASIRDVDTIKKDEVSIIFTPEISTTSNSSSILTWPPTNFTIDFNCSVVDAAGVSIASFKVSGKGDAQFSEFSAARDGGLSGRRAAGDLSEKLRQVILQNPALQ